MLTLLYRFAIYEIVSSTDDSYFGIIRPPSHQASQTDIEAVTCCKMCNISRNWFTSSFAMSKTQIHLTSLPNNDALFRKSGVFWCYLQTSFAFGRQPLIDLGVYWFCTVHCTLHCTVLCYDEPSCTARNSWLRRPTRHWTQSSLKRFRDFLFWTMIWIMNG